MSDQNRAPEYRPASNQGGRLEEPKPNARQGVSHQNVRVVLIVGTVSAIIVLAIVYFAFFAV